MNIQSMRLLAGLIVAGVLAYAGHQLSGLIDQRTRIQASNTQSIHRFEQALQTLTADAQRWDDAFMYLSEGDVPDLTSLHQRLELDRYLNLNKDRLSVQSVDAVQASDGTPLPLIKVCIATDDEVVRVEGRHFTEILDGVLRLSQMRSDLSIGQLDVSFSHTYDSDRIRANLSPVCLLIRTNPNHS
ncbi:MAG: hypothetical protein IBX50_05985 [Marinospirillum sp.]|uniref:hypothetical protein n=1 Tax=Marinospirillum sp. TaxID=2183934 RepID=UPI0019F6D0C2|nr:hypothetical protein [Marinospirillum sp.]MBE0506256.1 hypothetical protein [Marinospirillum sp.]